MKIWGTLIEKFPSSSFATPAGELILDSFNRAKNYENIETWARRLKARAASSRPRSRSASTRSSCRPCSSRASRRARRTTTCGRGGRVPARGEGVPEGRARRAGVRQRRARGARRQATSRRSRRPPSSRRARTTATAPSRRSARGRRRRRSSRWACSPTPRISTRRSRRSRGGEHPHYAKYEHTKDAAYNAVVLRVATQRARPRDRRRQQVPARLPNGRRGRRGRLPDGQGRPERRAGPSEAAELYQRYLPRAKNLDHRVEGYVLLAQAQIKVGDDKGAGRRSPMAVNLGKHRGKELSADGKYAAAHARYMEGERVLARFEQIQIQGDVKQLAGAAEAEGRAPCEAAQVFLDWVSLGVADWTTAALYQIGHMYESFAKSLRDAPAPAGALGRRPGGVLRRRSRSSSSPSRSRASTRTRTAGRRRSSSGSTTSGRRRCARRSGG